ncbi:MAG TPA: hypothetical protein DD001_17640 [Microcoleaceae bacterium UBA10368]|nr:hypothetical protein [Microcoleaceae cyanobacterium UBA10368]HCV31846.1 hypothetical protein [Microcoleaceae cyanobacterium UBA9251]
MSYGAADTKSLLDIALDGQSEEYRRKVLELAFKGKIEPTDPIFLILLATGRLEVLIQESPKPEDFELAFNRWVGRINKTLASYERVAVEKQEGQIAEAVNSLVRQTELRKVATSAGSLVVAAGILLTTLGIGALMGWMGLLWSQGGFAPGEAVHLTQEQAEALRWATSAEGKFARNLMRWNSDSLTDLECKKDVKRLGVTLEVAGKPATSGFCTIWVEPVEKRQFRD